jgi:purine nucleoside phosphorylase
MRVGGINCITNPAAGVTAQRLDHSDVVRVAGGMAAGVREIIRGVVKAVRG